MRKHTDGDLGEWTPSSTSSESWMSAKNKTIKIKYFEINHDTIF